MFNRRACVQPNLVINEAQYCVLEHVGRARGAGVLQSRLSKELAIDQRNLFHNLKHLKTRGIVRCQQVMLREGKVNVKTNLIHLCRFVKDEADAQSAGTAQILQGVLSSVITKSGSYTKQVSSWYLNK